MGFLLKKILIQLRTLEPSNTNLLKLISDIPLSLEGGIIKISDDLLSQLHEDINTCVAFSLALMNQQILRINLR